jgi:hypothetical protein
VLRIFIALKNRIGGVRTRGLWVQWHFDLLQRINGIKWKACLETPWFTLDRKWISDL